MSRFPLVLLLAVVWGASPSAVHAQPPASAIGPPGAEPAPPVPAVKAGMPVSDSSGARVGVVETVAETSSGGLDVVAKIDGKLVGLSSSTLQLRSGRVISSQTKHEMLASAGATP
jgi:hypothetical protein